MAASLTALQRLATPDAGAAAAPKPPDPGQAMQFQWGDFDADGLDDAVAISPAGALSLLRNARDGTLQDVTTSMGVDVQNAQCGVWEGFDQDGLVDLFVGT